MKLSFSKPQPGVRQHLILDMEHKEDKDAYTVIKRHILGKDVRADRRVTRTGVRYRFHRKYAEMILLTFPFVHMSHAVERRLMRAEAIEYDPADVPELDIPGFYADLYDFQKVSVGQMLEEVNTSDVMLNDTMGLGKTLQACAVLRKIEATPTLIIAPKNAISVWGPRHLGVYTDLTYAIPEGTADQRRKIIEEEVHALIINFEKLRIHPELAEYQWPLVIIDEFHRLKNPQAQVTKCFQQLSADRFLPISGTPILNRPEESWVILNRLWPEKYPSYWSFCRNLVLRSRGVGGKVVGYSPKHMKELREHIDAHSIRRRKEQVLKYLPEEIVLDRMVELGPEQRKLYEEILNESSLRLESGEVKSVTDARTMVMRLRQACFSPELYGGSKKSAKVEEVKLIVEELSANGEKAIIGSQWATATRILQRELAEYNPAYIDGSVHSMKKRMEQQDKFNNDPDCRLFIGTIGANREAISLGEATYVIFTDEEWSPLANEQFKDRSASGGLRGIGKDKVTVIRLYAEDTYDKEVSEILRSKMAVFNVLYEKDGGKPVQRNLMNDLKDLFLGRK